MNYACSVARCILYNTNLSILLNLFSALCIRTVLTACVSSAFSLLRNVASLFCAVRRSFVFLLSVFLFVVFTFAFLVCSFCGAASVGASLQNSARLSRSAPVCELLLQRVRGDNSSYSCVQEKQTQLLHMHKRTELCGLFLLCLRWLCGCNHRLRHLPHVLNMLGLSLQRVHWLHSSCTFRSSSAV